MSPEDLRLLADTAAVCPADRVESTKAVMAAVTKARAEADRLEAEREALKPYGAMTEAEKDAYGEALEDHLYD